MQQNINNRKKVQTIGMFPLPKRFSLKQAAEYMDVSTDTFETIALTNGLSICAINRKKWYLIAEIEEVFEKYTIVKKIN